MDNLQVPTRVFPEMRKRVQRSSTQPLELVLSPDPNETLTVPHGTVAPHVIYTLPGAQTGAPTVSTVIMQPEPELLAQDATREREDREMYAQQNADTESAWVALCSLLLRLAQWSVD
jgi:hypothetical protein